MCPAKGEIEVAGQAHLPSSKEMTPLYSSLVGYKLSLLVSVSHVFVMANRPPVKSGPQPVTLTRVFVMADRPPVKSGPQPVTLTWYTLQ